MTLKVEVVDDFGRSHDIKNIIISTKDQLISKGHFDVCNSTKKDSTIFVRISALVSKKRSNEKWQYRLWSFKFQDKKSKKICPKINIPKGNYLILRIGVMASCQKVKFWDFLTPLYYTNSQYSIISFGYVNFLAKIFVILYPWTP